MGMCQGGKPGTGKLYTDVGLCCSTHTSGCVVDGLWATAAHRILLLLQPLEEHTCCDITRSDSLDMDWLRKAYKFLFIGFRILGQVNTERNIAH